MNHAQQIAIRIKQSAKEKNIPIKQLLEKCELNINTISELSKGKQISYLSFAKIADYLGVSADYLLGRTDTPTGTGNINQSNIAITGDNNANVNTPAHHQDSTSQQLVEIFEKLSLEDKMKIINSVIELKNKEE